MTYPKGSRGLKANVLRSWVFDPCPRKSPDRELTPCGQFLLLPSAFKALQKTPPAPMPSTGVNSAATEVARAKVLGLQGDQL